MGSGGKSHPWVSITTETTAVTVEFVTAVVELSHKNKPKTFSQLVGFTASSVAPGCRSNTCIIFFFVSAQNSENHVICRLNFCNT